MLVGHESWPPGDEGLKAFLDLDTEDVGAIVKWTLRRSPRGRTWQGLHHVMEQKGYRHVRELGDEAAVAWARHLGVTADDHYQERVGA